MCLTMKILIGWSQVYACRCLRCVSVCTSVGAVATYLVLKSALYLQSEDILSGLHNFKGHVEVYDLVLMLRLGLGQGVR